MTIPHGDLLYEGKAKRIYASDNDQQVLVEFKNDATAFNAQKKAQLDDKGRLNCQISACLFELLDAQGIPTHYQGLVNDTWMAVQRVAVIPVEVVLRNTATGSLCRETPIAQGTALDPALLDLYYKDDDLGDPLLDRCPSGAAGCGVGGDAGADRGVGPTGECRADSLLSIRRPAAG